MSRTGSSYDDDEPDSRVPQQLIYNAQQRVQAARRQMWESIFTEGHVPEHVRTDLQTAVMLYYDELRKYKNRPQADAIWDDCGPWENGLDELKKIATRPSVTVHGQQGPRQQGTERAEAPPRFDPMELYEASTALDDVAEALGFAAHTPMPEGETDPI